MLLNFVVPKESDAPVPTKKRKKPKNRFQRRRQQKADAKAGIRPKKSTANKQPRKRKKTAQNVKNTSEAPKKKKRAPSATPVQNEPQTSQTPPTDENSELQTAESVNAETNKMPQKHAEERKQPVPNKQPKEQVKQANTDAQSSAPESGKNETQMMAKKRAAGTKFGSRKYPKEQAKSTAVVSGKGGQAAPTQSFVSTHIFSRGDKASFRALGLSREIVDAIEGENRMNLKTPTTVQSMAIPALIGREDGDVPDVVIKSQTGSGKTLAFVVPVIESLLKLRPKLSRADGTYAIVLAPTRELTLQIYQTVKQLITVGAFYWMIPGILTGGEKRKAEKSRLRKGVTVLVSTPGRLLDHLKLTQAFRVGSLRWLVVDEADRLLDLGFGQQVKEIITILDSRTPQNQRRTILTSATIDERVNQLGMDASLTKHPVFIDADAVAAEGGDKPKDIFTVPKQLRQHYVQIENCRDRLITLVGFLRTQHTSGVLHKALIFVSSCASADFLLPVLRSLWKGFDAGKKGSASSDAPSLGFVALHGNIDQSVRKTVLEQFCGKRKNMVLLCTDVAARGLNLPNVDWIIQLDPPTETQEYAHRIGRTARSGGKGQSVLFLLKHELEYLRVLRQHNLEIVQLRDPSPRPHVANLLLKKVVQMVVKDAELLDLSLKAYQTQTRAYATHCKEHKLIFNVRKIHLGHLAQSFGLNKTPKEISALIKSRAQAAKARKLGKGKSGKRKGKGDKRSVTKFKIERIKNKNNKQK